MVVTCEEMQEAENRLFASGGAAEPLMDKAGLGCATAFARRLVRRELPRYFAVEATMVVTLW